MLLLTAAGCSSSPPSGQPSTPAGRDTGAVSTSSTASPTTDTGSTPPSATTDTGCGPHSVTARPYEQPAPQCLTIGASLHITTQPSPDQPWSPPTSSDESALHCTASQLADGAAEATCTAVHTGTVIVTITTSPFAGDPHGPPQAQWQLHVSIA
jgi:hypothetical protein